MIKSFVEKVLFYLEISIKRLPRAKKITFSDTAKPLFIEFIGPAGVGKTTLYKQLLKHRTAEVSWITPEEFFNRNGKNGNDEFVYGAFFKVMKNKFESHFKKDSPNKYRMRVMNHFITTLNNSANITMLNKNETVISDEDLHHVFRESLYNSEFTEEEIQVLIKNRAIVYCYSFPEVISKQIFKRKEATGKFLPIHRFETFEELVSYQVESMRTIESFVKRLSDEFAVPALSIDTSEPTSKNIERINEFIKTLQQS